MECLKTLFCAQQALVDANVERKVTMTEAVAKVRELLLCGRSIIKSDNFEMTLKLTTKVQRITDLFE